VQDVHEGDLWFFPPGYPHSLQGIGKDGCEFLIAFDDGAASEFNTLLVTDWFAHTPPALLGQNFGVPSDSFKSIPLHNLWIFQGTEPGPLAADVAAVSSGGVPPNPFTFSLTGAAPVVSNASGSLRIVDSSSFKVSTTVASALVTVEPGCMREMHWHPNADEWQYWIKGEGRVTVFNAGPHVATQDFHAGDIGVVGRNQGHLVQNIGTTELQFLALFKSPTYEAISLSDWLAHTPPELIAQHLNIDPSILKRFASGSQGIVPASGNG
jgi:oxalate decarboxylase